MKAVEPKSLKRARRKLYIADVREDRAQTRWLNANLSQREKAKEKEEKAKEKKEKALAKYEKELVAAEVQGRGPKEKYRNQYGKTTAADTAAFVYNLYNNDYENNKDEYWAPVMLKDYYQKHVEMRQKAAEEDAELAQKNINMTEAMVRKSMRKEGFGKLIAERINSYYNPN